MSERRPPYPPYLEEIRRRVEPFCPDAIARRLWNAAPNRCAGCRSVLPGMTYGLCKDDDCDYWARWWHCQNCAWYADIEKWHLIKITCALVRKCDELRKETSQHELYLSTREHGLSVSCPEEWARLMGHTSAQDWLLMNQRQLFEAEQRMTAVTRKIADIKYERKTKKCNLFSVRLPMEAKKVRRAAWLRLALEELGLPWDVAWGVAGVSCWLT
jgi:hypothetical protein